MSGTCATGRTVLASRSHDRPLVVQKPIFGASNGAVQRPAKADEARWSGSGAGPVQRLVRRRHASGRTDYPSFSQVKTPTTRFPSNPGCGSVLMINLCPSNAR